MNVTEYRMGRNYVRVGDIVKVKPSAPKKRDGFEARVTAIAVEQDPDRAFGIRVIFQVVGGCRGRHHTRFVRPDRIQRVAQVRGGERRERKR